MKQYSLSILVLIIFSACQSKPQQDDWVTNSLNQAREQLAYAVQMLDDTLSYPRSVNPDGSLHLVEASDWTSGFFPGSLWYMYEYTRDPKWEDQARRWSAGLAEQQHNRGTHDIGFMLYCSFGNGYRLTGDQEYRAILLEGARSLASRYNPRVKAIRSWDWARNRWSFPVIIDNMMNLELLFWAARESGDQSFYDIAYNHALTTMNNHFRNDFSSFHVVDYDTISGAVRKQETFQGHADESAWARGQAWGLYGYKFCFRETRDPRFLEQAEAIALYYLNHPNLPEDKVPYWDFDAPGIPDEPRDASAAALVASALLELSDYTNTHREEYLQAAEAMLKSLSSPAYLATPGSNQGFILKHSTGYKPVNSEVDKPLNYADYYYLEAMLRYREKKEQTSL
ncbi:glycoside hydrolase family protein [Flammeovirgaceae bacterium 311]|nr:glycoside hydrolase family protein [Flammeovirgaceae bacterium 311]